MAFSPSCGNCQLEKGIPDYVGTGLSRFDALSARDARTAQLVREASGQSCRTLCDPTFLLRSCPQVQDPAEGKRDYILVYMLAELCSPELVEEIKALRTREGIPVHAVYYRHMWADRNIMSCSPFEWIRLIKNARYVITNTFHGFMFSVMAQANFAMEYSSMSESKTRDLVERFRLKERVFQSGMKLDGMLARMPDFTPAAAALDSESLVAENYLDEAIPIKTNP